MVFFLINIFFPSNSSSTIRYAVFCSEMFFSLSTRYFLLFFYLFYSSAIRKQKKTDMHICLSMSIYIYILINDWFRIIEFESTIKTCGCIPITHSSIYFLLREKRADKMVCVLINAESDK
jgi:hypothetical protein